MPAQPPEHTNEKTTPSPVDSTPPAPLALRFVNWIVDRVLSFVFSVVVLILVMFMLGVYGIKLHGFADWMYITVGGLLIVFCYYFLLEYFSGRTFGKAITGTQVLEENGSTPSAGRLAMRTLGRAIPFDEFIIFFNKGRTLHDSVSTTKVVRSKLVAPGRRRQGKIMPVIAIILLLPIAGMLGWIGFEEINGGHRIELSQNIPSDLKLIDYHTDEVEDHTYYLLQYRGNGRTVQINQMIAGYDFEPDETCNYMSPTRGSSLFREQIDSTLSCTPLNSSNSRVRAYKVSLVGEPSVSYAQIPDYILTDPPHRLAIKATEGTITEAEILAMTTNIKTYTSTQLTEIAKSNSSLIK